MTAIHAARIALRDLLASLPQGIAPHMVRFALGGEFSDDDLQRAIQAGKADGSIREGARGMLVGVV